jgi:hypothetical protein
MPVQELSPQRPSRTPILLGAVGVTGLLAIGVTTAALYGGGTSVPATPTPLPTQVVVATTATAPVETPVETLSEIPPTPATPAPTPVKTATPLPTRRAPTPTPTRVAAAPLTGTVKVLGTGYFEVYIDGAKAGAAPFDKELKPGSHLVRLVAPGPPAKTKSKTVTIVAGRRTEVFYDIEKDDIAVTQKR